jgi:hypothetical protein
MNKEDYIKIIEEKMENEKKSKEIILFQIENYYKNKEYNFPLHNYSVGDLVYLKKGTLLHGTYKNIDGLKEIVKDGLISSWFIDGRETKYPSSVGVWNLKKDYKLCDYINFYSGATIMWCGIFEGERNTHQNKTAIIEYDNLNNIEKISKKYDCHMWLTEQTKEARFMPSFSQNRVQVGIIFNSELVSKSNLLKGDILNPNYIDDIDVKDFVNENYYEKFIKERKNKDDFFTDRESAILFGIPSNFIEGILVGRNYESNKDILNEIKELLPQSYICNLDGKVIAE